MLDGGRSNRDGEIVFRVVEYFNFKSEMASSRSTSLLKLKSNQYFR